jgi:transposase
MTREQMIGRPVAGIDVAKATLDLHIDPLGVELHGDNSDDGRRRLIALLGKHDVVLVVIEATGRHHRRLAADLLDAGFNVAVVNPQRTRHFALSEATPEKTDRIDAGVLARFARAHDQLLLQKGPKKQQLAADLVSRRRALVQMRVAEKNRLADAGELPPLARRQGQKLVRVLEQQVEDLDRAIAKLIDDDEDWSNKARLIDSVPGVGPDTAHQLVACLPEIGRISRTQIAKLVGVAPLCDQSGPRDGRRAIQGGRHDVRTTLYMAAFNTLLHNDRFKAYAGRLRAAGKPFKVIVTAAMRKLLTILNQMVKTNLAWNPKLAFKLD